ncbi:MAG: hypothetical protein QXG99_02665 [Conexivisphaerales archaeon]
MSGATSHRRKYLTDMQSAIRYAIEVAYEMAIHIAIGYLRQLHSGQAVVRVKLRLCDSPPQPRFCHCLII